MYIHFTTLIQFIERFSFASDEKDDDGFDFYF